MFATLTLWTPALAEPAAKADAMSALPFMIAAV
jgi:hypothetical protein